MSRVGDSVLPSGVELGLGLDRYQEILGLPINAFNGLNDPDERPRFECHDIWRQRDRDYLAIWLANSEELREKELGFHVAPKYLVDEEYGYAVPILLDRKYLIEVGERATSDISIGYTLDHSTDPVVISVTTSVTLTSEIRIFYPGEEVEIRPSKISISGGVATIKVPRARLIDPDNNDNRDDALQYDDTTCLLTTVDVKRVYTDRDEGLVIVWGSEERVMAGVQTYPDGRETTQEAVSQVLGAKVKKISEVHVYPASSGVGAVSQYCLRPVAIRISYLSGRQSSLQTEIETARLAHTLMPNAPCTCDYVKVLWENDRAEDASGLVTPYGSSAGAVRAWLSDSRAKVGQGGKFPRTRGRRW